ncbi:MAG: hypothetical protein MI923_20165 [Phycisphaerales bacterium]|nr:hypothetical protein [Phycisphaerales bacterium]
MEYVYGWNTEGNRNYMASVALALLFCAGAGPAATSDANAGELASININEVNSHTPSAPDDSLEFVELYDGGVGNTASCSSTEAVTRHTRRSIWTAIRRTRTDIFFLVRRA